ncbi:MAG: retropepsin-like aspartic protease [Candidatus Paceibacterota bacterium]|jgi:hypothetical protein
MGWIKYSYQGQWNNDRIIYDKPLIEVEFIHGNKHIKVAECLIDSGCHTTHINAELAEYLGINMDVCEKVKSVGVGGVNDGFKTNIHLRLKDFDCTFESPVVVVKALPVPVLLGQNNFFDEFAIKFEKHNNTFELKKVD